MSDEKPGTTPEETPAPAPSAEPKADHEAEPKAEAETASESASDKPSEGAVNEPAADGTSKKRRKKRRRLEEPALRESLGADGRERPAFLLGFPADPELERLMRAFELGNYAAVREGAPELASRTTDAKVRAAAEELARRIEPDPLVKALLGMSIALFVIITFWAYKTHGG